MSAENKISETINKLQQARREIEAFSGETRDDNSRQLYQKEAEKLKQVINNISQRAHYVNNENEPARKKHSEVDAF